MRTYKKVNTCLYSVKLSKQLHEEAAAAAHILQMS